MFLIDDLIMSPGTFLMWVIRQVQEAAEGELEQDSVRITAELGELHRMLESGAIGEAEFDTREKALLDRLEEIEEQSDRVETVEGNRSDGD